MDHPEPLSDNDADDYRDFVGECIPFPVAQPSGFVRVAEPDEPAFDPAIHLDISPPESITLLDASVVGECPPAGRDGSRLAFTMPFRILSAEGMRVLRSIVDREKAHMQASARLAKYLRFLGYRSQWIRDFNQCPQLVELFSKLAGERLMPHSMASNYAHANIGEIGDQRNVDQWHADSTPYVLVILITDMAGATGGDLQLIPNLPPDEAFSMLAATQNNPPPENLLTVQYPGPGAAVFMQGSRIVHHVTPVRNAREARITVVNSYMPANPFRPESTRYATFKLEPTAGYEFAMHKAWRAREQLASFLQRPRWPRTDECVAALEEAARELLDGAAILRGDRNDELKYFDESTMAMTNQGYEEKHTKAN